MFRNRNYLIPLVLIFTFAAYAITEWNPIVFKNTVTLDNLTASTVPYLNSSKVLNSSAVSDTELGYLDNVTSAIQTQLNAKTDESTLTTKGDLYVATGSATIVRQGVGADGTFLKADSAQTNGVTWASVGTSLSTVTRNTTDTVDVSEDLILLTASGGAWTATLFDAAGNTGKVVRFIKTGHGTTAVTIDGDSADTIGGVANIQLIRIGDYLEIVSDGTNWQILDSQITYLARYHTPNGFGSSSTKIRRFTTEVTNIGNVATTADSSTLGLTTTINLPGIYSFTLCDITNGSSNAGLSLNSSELTTDIVSITAADRLAQNNLTGSDQAQCLTWTGPLMTGDVVRPHGRNDQSESSVAVRGSYSITRVK